MRATMTEIECFVVYLTLLLRQKGESPVTVAEGNALNELKALIHKYTDGE